MIPLSQDTRDAIGKFAGKVQNRGLLFQKMVISKNWGHPHRFNDANRYNVLRACTGGNELLSEDADSDQRTINKQNSNSENIEKAKYRKKISAELASITVDNHALSQRQEQNSLQLLAQLEKSYAGLSHTFVAQLGGRLLIHMAGGVQENAGMSLDRCFGLPIIAGSSVKGVTRHTALWDIRNETNPSEKQRKLSLAIRIFGFTQNDLTKGDFFWAANQDSNFVAQAAGLLTTHQAYRGEISFLHATPLSDVKIVAEVLTPHPRANEASKGGGIINPNFFPAVEKNSSFAFALIAIRKFHDTPEVLAQAASWLRKAVTMQGVGAKTGAGYGWFSIDKQAEEVRREKIEKMATEEKRKRAELIDKQQAEQAEKSRLASLSPLQIAEEAITRLNPEQLAIFAKELASKEEIEQRAFLSYITKSEMKETRKRWKKNKPDIWNPIQSTAESLNIPLP